MKKRKILVLFPFLGLLLSGCTVQEGFETVKSFFEDKVYNPVKDWITGGGKKEEPSGGETKTLKEIVEVKAPTSIKKGETLAPSAVDLVVKYSDNSTETVKAEEVVLDTSKAGDAVKGKAKYKGLEKEFTIKVTEDTPEPPVVVEEITPQKAIELCDAAGDGKVVDTLYRVKGVVAFGSNKDDNGWNGKFAEKSGEKELIFGSARTEEEYDTLDGATVVIEGYVELYQGAYKLSYLPASASPTKEKYNPVLISVTPAPVKEVASIDSIESAPKTVYVGEQIDKNDVILNVTYTDGEHAQAHPETVTVDSSTAGEVNATASIGSHSTTFPVTVIEKGKTVHAGSLEDPYTVSDAKIVFDTLAKDENTKGEVYVTGTIAADPAPALKGTRGLFYLTDGVCEKDLYVYNIDGINKAELTLADIPAGAVVVAKGAIKNYNGTFELCYVADVAGCELISVEKPAGKELVGYVENSAIGIPPSITQGESLNKSSITFKVKYKDETTEEVHPTSIELDTSKPGDSVAGNLVYGTVKYPFTIKVIEKVTPVGEITVKKTMKEIAEANGWEDKSQHLAFNLDENISVTATGKTNTGKYYTNGFNWRIYQGESPTVTISAGTLSIKKVTVEYTIDNTGVMIVGEQQVESGTPVDVNASTFAFSVGNTGTATNGQVRVSSIEVVYQGSTPVAVTSVEVSPSSLNLDVSDQPATLTATVLPEDATDKSVTWSSSNEAVATVDQNGKVTPVKSGTAVISAKAGKEEGKCTVTVKTKVQSVEITESLNVVVGNSKDVAVTVLPSNADDASYSLVSSNPEIAKVDQDGKVTGVAAGTATITVTTKDGEKKDTCLVTVQASVVPATSVALVDTEESIEMNFGDKLTLKAIGMPENATDREVEWALHDSESGILSVYSDGRIEALNKEGTVTVRATSVSNGDAYKDVTVTVSKVAVTSVELNKPDLSLAVDGSETLVASVSPDNATNPNVVWNSDDEDVATVSQDGEVTGKAEGEATITAFADENDNGILDQGEFSDTCVVSVTTVDLMKIAYEAGEALDHNKTTEGEYTFSGVVVGKRGTEYYVQKGSYGIDLYGPGSVSGLEVGKEVTVTAKMKKYSGVIETAASPTVVVGETAALPSSLTINSAATLEAAKQNIRVDVAGEVTDRSVNSYGDVTLTLSVNGDNIPVYIKNSVKTCEALSALANAQEGQLVSLENAVRGIYSNTTSTTHQIVACENSVASVSSKPIASIGEVTGPTSEVALNGEVKISDVSVTVNYEGGGSGPAIITEIVEAPTGTSGPQTGTLRIDGWEALIEFTYTVASKPAEGKVYTKVSTDQEDWTGDYILVYETGNIAWTGVDAGKCHADVTITSSTITNPGDSVAVLKIAKITGGYSIQISGGQYIGKAANANGIDFSDDPLVNTITVDSSGNVVITAAGGCTLRYNNTSGTNNERFRYYKSGQQAIQLYKLN